MGLRETLNEKPQVAYGLGGALVAIAVVALFFAFRGSGDAEAPSSSERAFFSIDDGATWFADDIAKTAPFDHKGKQAVRAHVYAAGGKQFVNHLERFTAEGKRLQEERMAASKSGKPAPARPSASKEALVEVKRPGEAAWTPQNDMAKAVLVLSVRPPAGTTGEAVPVMP